MGHSFSRPIPVIPYEEQDSFPTPLPPIPEDMNSVDDDYEIYVDHDDGQKIKARPKVKKEEILICPDGNPCLEQDTMSFLDSFLKDDLVAKGRSVFSNDALDKQKQIQDYLNNDQKVRDMLLRTGRMKA